MTELQQHHLSLLRALVNIVQSTHPLPWESFMARRFRSGRMVIYHSRAAPMPLDRMEDLDALAERGWIELHHLPSGTHVFTLTSEGCKAGQHDGRYPGLPEHV